MRSFFVGVLLAASASGSHASVIDFGIGFLGRLNHAPTDVGRGAGGDVQGLGALVHSQIEVETNVDTGLDVHVG